uniref:Uncharacterized protein n=1 Tax=Fagus sylvatica TaxID=28930 RepID=A0A2N9IY19_FAGSY
MDLNPYELDFSAPFDEPLFDSSSDDELELTLVVAIEEERWIMKEDQNHIVVLFMAEHSSRVIFCKATIVEAYEPYFIQKRNAARRLGLSSLQKMTVTIRMLAYGVIGDLMDEYVRIGESTAIESLKKFVEALISIFSDEYLRSLNSNDIARLLTIGQNRGFPGMLGSIRLHALEMEELS